MTQLQVDVPFQAPRRGAAWIGAVAGLVVLAIAAGLIVLALRSLNPSAAPADIKPARAEQLTAKSRRFVAAEEGFQATFPKPPKREVKRVPVDGGRIKIVGYTVETKKAVWMVATIDVPKLPKHATLDLEAFARHFDGQGKIVSSHATRYEGREAHEFTLKVDDGTVRGLVVRDRQRVYQVIAGSKKNAARTYQDFVETFQIQ